MHMSSWGQLKLPLSSSALKTTYLFQNIHRSIDKGPGCVDGCIVVNLPWCTTRVLQTRNITNVAHTPLRNRLESPVFFDMKWGEIVVLCAYLFVCFTGRLIKI